MASASGATIRGDDAGVGERLSRIFRFALASAEKAGDWHLRAKILSSMARQAIWTGRPDEGLTYAAAQHAGDTGHALFDVAVLGRSPEEAGRRLAAAVAGHDAVFARSRAISQTKLASLTMAAGDPVEAAVIGAAALDAAGTIRSRRSVDDLRELVRYANRHQNVTEVAELRHRITTVVLTL